MESRSRAISSESASGSALAPVTAEIDTLGFATLTCPHCGLTRRVNARAFAEIVGPVRANCTCGRSFPVRFRRRLTGFKPACLPGEFVNVSSKADRGEMLVEGLSMNGLVFSSIGRHSFLPGDALKLYFVLDNLRRTEIRKNAQVVEVNGQNVTVSFYNLGGLDADLGFYLRG